jgi:hypothetical protein
MYVWLELIYHLPLSFWAIGALIRGEIIKTNCIPSNLDVAMSNVCMRVQMIPASQSTS